MSILTLKVLYLLLIFSKASPKILKIQLNDQKTQLINFLAGGIAGTIASTVTMPLEVIKTQLQTSRIGGGKSNAFQIAKKIYQSDRFLGFYRGLKPMLLGIIPTRAVYFWSYTASKTYFNNTLGIKNTSPTNHLLSAFSAGITSNTLTNPIWMVKTRFQILADTTAGQRAYSSYGDVIKTIFKEEGLQGFFKGLTSSYIGCFEGAIQWVVYERLKAILSMTKGKDVTLPASRLSKDLVASNDDTKSKRIQKKSSPSNAERTLTASEYFFTAAAAKFIAICVTYPHEVVRTRIREQATNGSFRYKGFFSAFGLIAKEEGRRGLYGGMGIHLLRSVPNAAVMLLTFEYVSRWLKNLQSKDDHQPHS